MDMSLKKKYNNIVNDVEAIVNRSIITRTQKKKEKKSRNYIAIKRNFG